MATRSPARRKAPPLTTVHLVRHGQTTTTGKVLPGRAKGLHLADEGRRQAEAVAQRLEGSGATALYTSPLERTRETAAPIARVLGVKAIVERGLLECDFGEWTGAELKALMKRPEWKTVQRYPSGFRFPDGESFAEMQTRVTGAVQRLVEANRGATIVCVSHADPIKAVVADAVGTHLDLFQRIVVSPCSVSTIAYGDDGPIVLGVNSTTADLASLRPS